MFYFKKKTKEIVQPLSPTFCEQEERQYFGGSISNDRKLQSKLLFMGFCVLVCVGAFQSLTANVCTQHGHVSEWDGAGNQWICGNCGTTNYCWQMSCSNCGNSQ